MTYSPLLNSFQFLSPTFRTVEIDVSSAGATGIIGPAETARALGGLLAAHERMFEECIYLPPLLEGGRFEARYRGFDGWDLEVWVDPKNGSNDRLPLGVFGFHLNVEPPPRGATWKLLSSGRDCLAQGLLEYFEKLEAQGIGLQANPRRGIAMRVPENLEGGVAVLAQLGISPHGTYFVPTGDEARKQMMSAQAENLRRGFFVSGYPDSFIAELGQAIRSLVTGITDQDFAQGIRDIARMVVNDLRRKGFTPEHLAVLSDELLA